jgi:hypothetical protein
MNESLMKFGTMHLQFIKSLFSPVKIKIETGVVKIPETCAVRAKDGAGVGGKHRIKSGSQS